VARDPEVRETGERSETVNAAGNRGAASLMRTLRESKVLYAVFLVVAFLGALTPFLLAGVPVPGVAVALISVILLHVGSVKRSP